MRALAIDLGGTELRVAIVDQTGAILARRVVLTLAREGPPAVLAQMEGLAAELRAELPGPLVGVGVGCPGPLDLEQGVVRLAATLDGWTDVPVVAELERRLGLPVQLENDANVAALGEWRFGAGRGTTHMVYVTVSTGIGGGVIEGGRLLHGRNGMAAEVGHMVISQGGEPCGCGGFGCWEALASGTALGRRATAARGTPTTAREIAEAARSGDPVARSLMEDEARLLGIGCANLLHLYAPDRIVLGGGVADSMDLMEPIFGTTVRAHAMPSYRDTPIVPAFLGGLAGLVGAAGLVFSSASGPTADDAMPPAAPAPGR